MQYTLHFDAVYRILRYSKYILIARSETSEQLRDIVESIIFRIMREGQVTILKLVNTIKNEADETVTVHDLQEAFCHLFENHSVCLSKDLSDNFEQTLTSRSLSDKKESLSLIRTFFEEARVSQEDKESSDPPASKKRKKENSSDKVFWKINFKHFDQALVYAQITTGVRGRFGDERVSAVAKSFLSISSSKSTTLQTTTDPAFRSDIYDVARKETESAMQEDEFSGCLSMLVESSDGIVSCYDEDLGGGKYCFEVLKSLERMVESLVSTVVEQKFGSKFSRVFRIILTQKLFPQKRIEEAAMLPPKDCRDVIFTLAKDGFVKTNYYSKFPDYLPAKTHYVYRVDLESVVRMLIATCHKAVLNTIQRRHSEQNQQLIDKKRHINQIIEDLRQQEGTEQQINDLENLFTSHDQEVLAAAETAIRKCHLAELQTDDTCLVLESWLKLRECD